MYTLRLPLKILYFDSQYSGNRPDHHLIFATFCRMFILELIILAMSFEENLEGVTFPVERLF